MFTFFFPSVFFLFISHHNTVHRKASCLSVTLITWFIHQILVLVTIVFRLIPIELPLSSSPNLLLEMSSSTALLPSGSHKKNDHVSCLKTIPLIIHWSTNSVTAYLSSCLPLSMAQRLSEIPCCVQRSPCSILLDFQSCDPSLRTRNQQKWLVGSLQPFEYRVRLANSVRLGCVCKYSSLISCATWICIHSQYSVLIFTH